MSPIEDWNRAVQQDSVRPAMFLERVRAVGAVYGDDRRPLCTVRRPKFIRPDTARRYLKLVSGLHLAFREARALIEEDGLDGRPESLAARLGVPPVAIELARLAPRTRSAATLARLDTVCRDGHPWVLELNAEAPAGMGYMDALTEVFVQDPLLPVGAEAVRSAEAAARAVVAAWRALQPVTPDKPPQVALVDFLDVPTRHEFLLMQAAFAHIGVPCTVADPRALRFDGARLWHEDVPIDAVYRRLLVEDILSRPEDCADLIAAYRAQAVCVVNSLRTPLLHSKGLIALLHDPRLRQRLPDAAVELIDQHVPWTGLLGAGHVPEEDDLRARLLREPDAWILKPLRGHGGQGIVRGWQLSRPDWARAVEAATAHVAQARVPEPLEAFPDATRDYAPVALHPSLDPFLIDGRLSGFLCRLHAPRTLGNVAEGATLTPVFVSPG